MIKYEVTDWRQGVWDIHPHVLEDLTDDYCSFEAELGPAFFSFVFGTSLSTELMSLFAILLLNSAALVEECLNFL